MIAWAFAIFVVVAFVLLVKQVRLVEHSQDAISTALGSLKILGDPNLSDDEKEVAMQRHSIKLFKLFFFIAIGGTAALLIPVGIVWGASQIDWVNYDLVMGILLSWEFILGTTVVGFGLYFLISRGKKSNDKYSGVDQLLHKLAFDTYSLQVPVARFESRFYTKKLHRLSSDKPVFITSLPRAGTTLLLECCAGLHDFATHCYRDMPFVMTPNFWNGYSSIFKQSIELRERAHGDGMMINLDSPEAFEEIIWKTFWNDHYHENHIDPWETEQQPEFFKFLSDHMKKIILLRRGIGSARYISKNNLNIARTKWLTTYFPGATIVIPVRDPIQHSVSLLKQHKNFLQIHQEDKFASDYMRAIGHFDFGNNLRPVNFNNWMDHHQIEDALNINFWLEYWIVTYRFLLSGSAGNISIIDYQTLCADPGHSLSKLAELLQLEDVAGLTGYAENIHAGSQRDIGTESISPQLLTDAATIYSQLKQLSINN